MRDGAATFASKHQRLYNPGSIREEDVIGVKVFVGNLSYDVTTVELESLFSQVGQVVEVLLPTDRATGRPRGFGFVEFTDGSAVSEAIERFDGYELMGRNLRVNEAEERRPRPPGGGGGGYDPGPSAPKGGKGGKPKGSRRNIRGRKRGF